METRGMRLDDDRPASLRGLDMILSEGAGEPRKAIGKVSIEARFGLQGGSL